MIDSENLPPSDIPPSPARASGAGTLIGAEARASAGTFKVTISDHTRPDPPPFQRDYKQAAPFFFRDQDELWWNNAVQQNYRGNRAVVAQESPPELEAARVMSHPGVVATEGNTPERTNDDGQRPSRQFIERKLLERPDDIREAARNLSEAFKTQTNELRKSKPNEPSQLAQYENLLSFFEQMAAGLADLADALDRAFSSAVTSPPTPLEPVLLGKAADIARGLQLLMQRWLDETGTAVIDVPVRIGALCAGVAFLHSIGADSLGAIATLGWLVRPRGTKDKAAKRRAGTDEVA